jgi:large subunit ribosomal protein L23
VADLRHSARDIIIRPIITEKSVEQAALNKYTFEVARDANKIEIRNAIQEIFGVHVTRVCTLRVAPKSRKDRRRPRVQGYTREWKKAIVTLKEGDRIEVAGSPLFEH